jgi:ABC-type lipoprotein release transport system permease subunit
LVSESELSEIIAGDHTYLAVAMDRGALPTNSIDDVEDQLNEWKVELDGLDYGEDIRMRAYDMDAGLLDFLNIFLIFIQIFDYIVMIPIVVLSISVLVYGLLLSLEQRRKEIAIHRVIGGSAKGLQRMVMGELFVIATIAWLMGYLLAIATVPLVLSSVGFMAFRLDDVRTPPTLSMMTTLGTAVFTIGLALLFGRGRTKQFLATEINEGVQELPKERAPRYWLHWLTFALGMIALIDSIMEDQNVGDGEGIVSNFFYDALLAIFGPFLLWIGGALVLSRIGAKGPVLMQFVLGRTKLLKDVRRGLTGSGSAEGVGRLAFIILLTLSIVTMAAVQGYTGTVVDEQTADLQTGGDLNVQFRFPVDEANASAAVSDAWDSTDSDRSASFTAFTVPTFLTSPENDEKNLIQVWVITNRAADHLLWNNQALPGTVKQTLEDLREVGTVTHGEDAGWDLDLRDGGDMATLNWSDGGGTPIQMEVTTLGEHSWIPGLPTTDAMNVLFVGEATWRFWLGDAAPSAENLTAQRWLFDVGAMAEEEDGLHLRQLAVQLSTDSSVGSADDWSSQHRDVERNGGLVFGTPGLLSLQFVVSALAAIASSFVFLSLVLDRRKKELSILQAIGASPNQVTRLVLFEILSITIVSMLLGGLLGIGIAYAFNDLFNLFGIIFQAFGGEGTAIERTLVWPIGELLKIGGIVLAAVLAALVLTMRKSLTSDLAVVLKGE